MPNVRGSPFVFGPPRSEAPPAVVPNVVYQEFGSSSVPGASSAGIPRAEGLQDPGDSVPGPTPRQMFEALERMNARMESLARKVEEGEGREREMREKLSSQELIIGLLRDDLKTSHGITTDKFNEALQRQNETFLKLSANFESLTAAVKEGGSGRSGMIDTKGIGKPTIFKNDEAQFVN